MASIRRTLSPSSSSSSSNGHDHLLPQIQIQIQKSSSSLSSSNYCPSSPFRRLLMWVMGLLLFFHNPSPLSSRKAWAAHHHHHHHHLWWYYWNWNWKRYFLRFVLFFLLGFLLGFSPFAHLHDDAAADLKPHHFFFDSIASSTPATGTSSNTKPIIDNIININNPHLHTNLVLVRPTKMMTEAETIKPVELQKSNNNINNPTEKEEEKEKEKEMNPSATSDLPPPELELNLNLKMLIVVTPTYNRALQAYYLNRLGQTLRLVPPPLLWIVVEMKSAASIETADILRRTGVMYRHLLCDDSNNKNNIKDRGIHQRNTALHHIHRHSLDGIVYFADDDNIYSLNLFHQLRNIRRFGTWPVAMLAQNKNKAILEGPVCNGSHVIGWHTNEKSKQVRRFHVDMSGFAFNSTILWDPKRWQHPTSHAIRQLDTVKEGFQETTFIEQVVEDESQMEGIPHGCSKIMNWHLHLEARHLSYPKGWQVSRNLDAVSSLG